MEKGSRIYVAGHRGLVGSALVRALGERGYGKVLTRPKEELDLTRQADVERFFAAERPEYVFLAAAKVGGILANDSYRADFIRDNLLIATNVVTAAHAYGVRKLLNLGSSCIYPKLAPQPLREEYLLTGPLEPTNEPYAIAKIAAIKLCRYYNEQYGTDYISVMPTNLYGPSDNFNLETSHVMAALIRKFHLAKLLSEKDYRSLSMDVSARPLGFSLDDRIDTEDPASVEKALSSIGVTAACVEVWGSGEPRREFLHVDDLADACVFLMERYSSREIGEFINIGTGTDMRIRDLAELVREAVGFEGGVRFDASKPDGTPRKLLDVGRMRGLGWEPRIPMEDGVRKTYQWYLGTVGV